VDKLTFTSTGQVCVKVAAAPACSGGIPVNIPITIPIQGQTTLATLVITTGIGSSCVMVVFNAAAC